MSRVGGEIALAWRPQDAAASHQRPSNPARHKIFGKLLDGQSYETHLSTQ
jgi:hypothetical protein